MSISKRKNTSFKSNVHNLAQLIKTPKKTVIARSRKQSDYIKALTNNDITMALGPAGTGKSFLAVSVAMTMLFEKSRKSYFIQTSSGSRRKTRFFAGRYERKSRSILETSLRCTL